MVEITEATYVGGVLKPSSNLGLREKQRVRLIIEVMEEETVDRQAALDQFLAGLDSMEFFLKGTLPSRDELHDRS